VKPFLSTAALVAALVLAPTTYAQSAGGESDPMPDAEATEVQDVPTETTAPTPTPTPLPAVVHAPPLSVMKLDRGACTVTSGGRAPTCAGPSLPDPNNAARPYSQYDWSAVRISQLGSPVGAPLFASMMQSGGGFPPASGTVLRLASADSARFTFTCPQGTCTGSASDVWRAMPAEQKEAYLSQIIRIAHDDQNWDPKIVGAAVESQDIPITVDRTVACARMELPDGPLLFAPTCAGPWGDHLT
jgi:hypothetical protein